MADSEQLLRSLRLSVVTRTSKEEPIGVGSYANVYEVMLHGTLCAAKEMHPILVNETKKQAFLVECLQSSRLLHPNVVQFLGIYYPSPNAKLPWLVMELMYISLRGLIEKYEKDDFPFHFKLSILMDTCHGLQFLHSQNIIHRDLSSNNILLTKHLVAKISDLGMAKVIPPGLQKHTQAPGTIVFMPPEALSITPKYGKSVDVFAMGCVLLHMISMEWPMPLDKIGANKVILSEVERRERYFINMVKYASLKQLVEQCLQDEPERRPVIEEVVTGLKKIDSGHQPHEDDDIIDLFTSIVKHSELMAQKDQQLLSKDKQLVEKDQQLIQKDQQISQKDQQLLSKDQQLLSKDQQLYKKDQQLMQKDQQISQQLLSKDQQISQKGQQLLSKDQQLHKKDQQLIQKDQQISQKDQQLLLKDQQLYKKDQQLIQKDQQIAQKDQQISRKDQIIYQKDQLIKQKDQESVEKEKKQVVEVEDSNKVSYNNIPGF